MAKAASPIPAGYHTITPYLTIQGAAQALDFYQKAFAAEEVCRMPGPTGKLMHAEMKIGDSHFMLSDEFPGMGNSSPKTLGGTASGMHLYVTDVDASFNRAVGAGCTAVMPPMDMFWGDRFCKLSDPFGHSWSLATHKEDLTPEEMEVRGQAAMAEMGKNCT